MATIVDVANEAKVSVATVSRVLNNSFAVTEEKRKLVLAAIEKVGYQPTVRTKSNRSGGGKIIFVVTSILVDDLFDSIQAAANDLGYNVIFNYIGKSKDATAYSSTYDLLRILQDQSIAGILLINAIAKDENLQTYFNRIPVVQIGEYCELNPTYAVLTDDIKASFDMTQLLVGKGHRKIAFIFTGDNVNAQSISASIDSRVTSWL